MQHVRHTSFPIDSGRLLVELAGESIRTLTTYDGTISGRSVEPGCMVWYKQRSRDKICQIHHIIEAGETMQIVASTLYWTGQKPPNKTKLLEEDEVIPSDKIFLLNPTSINETVLNRRKIPWTVNTEVHESNRRGCNFVWLGRRIVDGQTESCSEQPESPRRRKRPSSIEPKVDGERRKRSRRTACSNMTPHVIAQSERYEAGCVDLNRTVSPEDQSSHTTVSVSAGLSSTDDCAKENLQTGGVVDTGMLERESGNDLQDPHVVPHDFEQDFVAPLADTPCDADHLNNSLGLGVSVNALPPRAAETLCKVLSCMLPEGIPDLMLARTGLGRKVWDARGRRQQQSPETSGVHSELVSVCADMESVLAGASGFIERLHFDDYGWVKTVCRSMQEPEWRLQSLLMTCHAFPLLPSTDPL